MKTKLPSILLLIFTFIFSACGDPSLKSLHSSDPSQISPSLAPVPSPTPAATHVKISPEDVFGADPDCAETDPHPVGQSIAEKFSAPYEKVMTWYCSDVSFEDILIALQTSKLSDKDPEDFLLEIETKTWEQVWDELGLMDLPTNDG